MIPQESDGLEEEVREGTGGVERRKIPPLLISNDGEGATFPPNDGKEAVLSA